jgi:hypothetical protein
VEARPDLSAAREVVALTAKLMVTDCVRLPDVPVIVIEDNPAVASLADTNTSLLVLVVLPGSNDAVTPVGSRDARSVTLPSKPPEGLTVIVLVAFSPCLRYTVLGDASSEKLSARSGAVREKDVAKHAAKNRSRATERRRFALRARPW